MKNSISISYTHVTRTELFNWHAMHPVRISISTCQAILSRHVDV
jgi:hypothetical protein